MRATIVALLAAALAACSSAPASHDVAYNVEALPSGPLGAAIREGRDIVMDTPEVLPHNVRAGMSCAACHIGGGTVARGGTFVGIYAHFPQFNRRSGRIITLQDRLAECFLYSMNGTPPEYYSKPMIALVAYIAWLSRGTPTLAKADPHDGFIVPLPSSPPDPVAGAAIYAQRCQACHGADGAGIAASFPPLWGARSFNAGAGMAHLDRMTGFVKYNMPQNAPGSLSLADAYNVSAFVLSHKRPGFARATVIVSRPQRADYF
jgi:thiosulfate dehydrogenase